jgi:hypothetical protein
MRARTPSLIAETALALREILRWLLPAAALVVLLFTLVVSRGTLSLGGYGVALAAALVAVAVLSRRRGQGRLWALYLVGFIVFAHLRALTDETGIAVQTQYVIDIEEALFFGVTPTVWLQERLFRGDIGPLEMLSSLVYVTYFLAPHVAALLIWRYRPGLFKRFVVAVLGVVYVGLLVSLVLPTTPPWLAAGEGALPAVARVVRLTLLDLNGSADTAYEVVGPNAVAAMPSLHMALTVLILAATWGHGRLRVAAGLYSVAMGFALVYGAEHYVTDLLAGAVVGLAVWRGARMLEPAVGDRALVRIGPVARRHEAA